MMYALIHGAPASHDAEMSPGLFNCVCLTTVCCPLIGCAMLKIERVCVCSSYACTLCRIGSPLTISSCEPRGITTQCGEYSQCSCVNVARADLSNFFPCVIPSRYTMEFATPFDLPRQSRGDAFILPQSFTSLVHISFSTAAPPAG